MAVIKYDPKTGRLLKPGEKTKDAQGNTITQGQEYNEVFKTSYFPNVANVSGPTANAAQYGASGRGEYLDQLATKDQKKIEETAKKGAPASEYGDVTKSTKSKPYTIPTFSKDQSKDYVKQSGLKGLINDDQFAGLTATEAQVRAQELKGKYKTTSLTSYAYNPETTNKIKKEIESLRLKINENNNTPWKNQESKIVGTKGLMEATSSQLAKLFDSTDSFLSAYNSDTNLKRSVDEFIKLGGSTDSIATKIKPPTMMNTEDIAQDTTSYLSKLNPEGLGATSDDKAYNDILPELEVAQKEIARQTGMADEVRSLYFGSEDEVGILEQKKKQAEEKKKIIAQKARNDERTLKEQADSIIEENEAQQEIDEATIEQNRLSAKNYMTGMLAKLGALNTTGAAPAAIATLDQKYQRQSSELKTKYRFKNADIKNELSKKVRNLQVTKEEEKLRVSEDLTKDQEEIAKEINKIEQASEKEIYRIIEKYSTLYRTQSEKYSKEAKSAADKYVKDYLSYASKGYDVNSINKILSGTIEGVVIPKKPVKGAKVVAPKLGIGYEQQLASSRGTNGKAQTALYNSLYEDWVSKGGTISSFLSKFPVARYVNVDDSLLLPELKPLKSGGSSKSTSDREA